MADNKFRVIINTIIFNPMATINWLNNNIWCVF